MVTVSIFIEGDNPENSFFEQISEARKSVLSALETVSAQSTFREAFNILFSQAINRGSEIKIETLSIGTKKMSEVNKSALKLKLEENPQSCLLLDLDTANSERENMILNNFNEFETNRLFFMVQQMESWIISQPNCVIKYYNLFYKKINRKINFTEHKFYYSEDFENINKPEDKLSEFIKYFWQENTSNKKAKYHKTRIAPSLIKLLDFSELTINFVDAKLINGFIKQS